MKTAFKGLFTSFFGLALAVSAFGQADKLKDLVELSSGSPYCR